MMERPVLPLPTDFGTVRRARPADGLRIVQMVAELAAHHGDTATLTAEALSRDLFSERPWIAVVVAEAGGRLIGYAALCGLIRLQFGARGMDIHHLFVAAGFRRRGVARSLVQGCRIEARALGCRYLTVSTHPDNHAAQAVHAALGFERQDARPPRFAIRLDP